MIGYMVTIKHNDRFHIELVSSHGLMLESGMRVTRVIVVRGFSRVGTVTAVYIPSSFCKVSLDAKTLSRSLITSKSCYKVQW